MSERLSDEEYRAWIDAGSPNALEAWAIIIALRAERAKPRPSDEERAARLAADIAFPHAPTPWADICFDRVVSQRDQAQKDAKDARALLLAVLDSPRPLALGDIRARIEAMLEKKP
jgi:hypothetical protein